MTLPQRITVTIADGIQQAAADARYSRADSGSNGLLASSAGTSATSVTLRQALPGIADDCYIAINPFSTDCKLRKITGVSSTTYSFSGALGVLMSADTLVIPFYKSEFSVLLFGATGDGSTDDTAAINAALTQVAVTDGTLYFPAGTYVTDGGHEIPSDVRMLLDKDATLSVAADNIGLTLGKGSALEGGRIKANVASYTGPLIEVDGDNLFHFQDNLNYIRGIYLEGFGDDSGYGLQVRAGGSATQSYVTGFTVQDVIVSEFDYGVRVEIIADASNNCFLNSNLFHNIWTDDCKNGLYINGVQRATFNQELIMNHFEQFYIQSEDGIGETAAYINAGYNVLDLTIWDWRESTPALVMGADSYHNRVSVFVDEDNIRDDGYLNDIHNRFVGINNRGYFPPYDATQVVLQHYGPHSNVLAGGSSLHTISQTSGPAASIGTVANAITTTPGTAVQWASIDSGTPVVIEVTFSSTLNFVDAVGVNFRYYQTPANLKIELYDDTDAAWLEVYDIENAYDLTATYADLTAHPNGEVFWHDFTNLRLTFSGSSTISSGTTVVRLDQVYLFARSSLGNQWAQKFMPTMYGNVTIDDGTYNGGHLVLGSYHLWVDGTGDLRIKSGAPSSATDGTVVGSQS